MTDSPRRDAVDRAVADHYARASLDASTLRALRDQIEAASPDAPIAAADTPLAWPPDVEPAVEAAPRAAPDREPIRATRRMRWMAGVAALSVFAVALLAWPTPALTGEAVALEIASSHIMSLTPDVEAGTFDEAREGLAKLDFAAVRPSEDTMPDFEVRGARYTRIGGEMGAEFQIEDAAGRACSLFQVRDDAAFRNVQNAVYEVDGVRVRVWREAGLLMGLAESVS